MQGISWKDVLHYGSAVGLVMLGGLAMMGLHIPGVTIDPTICFTTAAGIFAAGLKGGVTSGNSKPNATLLKSLVFLIAASAALATVSPPAFAATAPSSALAAFNTDVLQKIAADAQAASADAKANNDVIAQTCYDAIAADAQTKLSTGAATGGGALTLFQKVRDISRMNASPAGTQLIVGCAPLVQDAKLNFLQFFANVGAAVLLKGVVPLP